MKIIETLAYIFVILLLAVNSYMNFQIYNKMGEIKKVAVPKNPCHVSQYP